MKLRIATTEVEVVAEAVVEVEEVEEDVEEGEEVTKTLIEDSQPNPTKPFNQIPQIPLPQVQVQLHVLMSTIATSNHYAIALLSSKTQGRKVKDRVRKTSALTYKMLIL